MLVLLLELVVAPALVILATLASRRWGEQAGGLVSAFPAIAGPVLLIEAVQHGGRFAARSASATLAGLVTLSAFALVYAHMAARRRWPGSLVASWAVAAALGAVVASVSLGPLASIALAGGSLLLARHALPGPRRAPEQRAEGAAPLTASGLDLLGRVVATVGLIIGLVAAAGAAGPAVGGVLAGLPALASVLAVFTHARRGSAGVRALLQGMLGGMSAFAAFCAAVALLGAHSSVAVAFALATVAAAAAQAIAVALTLGRRQSPAGVSSGPSGRPAVGPLRGG